MKAIVWTGGHDMVLREVPDPRAAAGQVLVRVRATAICGSDLHLPDFGATPPVIPGHEAAGEVVELGEGVTSHRVGDRVALDPVQRCGTCWPCLNGVEHLCTNTRHLGWGSCAGTWAELVAVDAVNAHPVAPAVTLESAALSEPAAVCWQSYRRAGLGAGQSVLVIGDGPFGFLHAVWARSLGCGPLVVAGHHETRLGRIAAATGALVCNTKRQDLTATARAAAGEVGFDVAVEATGASASPGLGIAHLRPRGSLVLFSYVWKPEPLDMGAIHMKELALLGSCRSLGAFGPVLSAMSTGSLNTAAMIDARYPLEGLGEALRLLREDKGRVFKVLLTPAV